jgi:hypothetical protein
VAGLLENDRVAIVTETLAEIVLDNVRAVIANDGAWLTATRTTIRRRGMVGSDRHEIVGGDRRVIVGGDEEIPGQMPLW